MANSAKFNPHAFQSGAGPERATPLPRSPLAPSPSAVPRRRRRRTVPPCVPPTAHGGEQARATQQPEKRQPRCKAMQAQCAGAPVIVVGLLAGTAFPASVGTIQLMEWGCKRGVVGTSSKVY